MNAAIAAIILTQFAAMEPDVRPPMSALMSPTASARFALERVCGPAVAANQPIPTGRALIPIRREPGVFLVMGVGRVAVRQAPGNGCYFRVDQGNAEGLRNMVLEVLDAAGTNPRQLSDNERTGAAGSFRQETYCLDFAGRTGGMLMSTALGRHGYRLQVTLIPQVRSCGAPAPAA